MSIIDRAIKIDDEFRTADDAEPSNDNAKHRADQISDDTREEESPAIRFDDIANGLRFAKLHAADVRYCHPWASWLVYSDGRRFKRDDTGAIDRLAKATVKKLWRDLPMVPQSQRDAAYAWAKRSGSVERLAAMLKAARSEEGIAILPDQLDADSWLFNCASGTIDLRTGKEREHRRQDLITKLSPVRFDPRAECPLWMSVLNRSMGGRLPLVKFIQRFAGYSLTGDTREQCFILAHGTGENGKSTLLETLQFILGDYGRSADFTTFLARDSDTVRNDLAELRGARMVSSIEVSEGRRLSEAIIKSLTGQDTIRARFLFQEAFQFQPQFKLWLACNHPPVIRGTDDGIWRRVKMLPFDVKIPDDEKDRQLMQKLRAEAPGILAWMVRGCLDWQGEGLAPPAEVASATANYRTASDTFGAFLESSCIVGPDAKAGATELFALYRTWAALNGEQPMSQMKFGLQLAERGFESARNSVSGRKEWRGIGIAVSEHSEHSEYLSPDLPT